MRILAALTLALTLSSPALAQEVQVKTPLGQTITGTKHTSPKEGSIEALILKSLKMIEAKEWDEWMKTYCHKTHCPDDKAALEAMKNYNLTASSKSAHACMHDDKSSIIVTRRDGDPAKDTTVTTYIFCGEKRMPTPSTAEKVGDKWLISSFSW